MRAWKVAGIGLAGLLLIGAVQNMIHPEVPPPHAEGVAKPNAAAGEPDDVSTRPRDAFPELWLSPDTECAPDRRCTQVEFGDLLAKERLRWARMPQHVREGCSKTTTLAHLDTCIIEAQLEFLNRHPHSSAPWATDNLVDPALKASLSAARDQRPPSKGPAEVQYDPKVAEAKMRMDAALGAVRGCLHGQALLLMRNGYRNREEMADSLSGACVTPLLRIHADLTEDAMLSLTKRMAYEAIRDVELANGG